MTPDILEAVGNTSLVPLRRIVLKGCARILVKLEWGGDRENLPMPLSLLATRSW